MNKTLRMEGPLSYLYNPDINGEHNATAQLAQGTQPSEMYAVIKQASRADVSNVDNYQIVLASGGLNGQLRTVKRTR